MTFKFMTDDCLLFRIRTRGVPSQIIIRNPQNRTVPAFVIEKAASLAAYFSKRQTESLCPVIVTSKKFVRKTKDLLPGMVIVDREEEVVLVKPELWD